MAFEDISKNLNEFQSTHNLVLESRPAGFSQRIRMMIQGNSLLSSVFVKSITGSPTLSVKYFEITTGLEADEQRFLGNQHPLITAASTTPDQKLLTPFHNKLFCDVEVTGTGSVEFGIYVTVVASFASLLDQALRNHLEDVDLANDQGMPWVLQDPSDGKWYLAKGDKGCLTVTNAPGTGTYVDVQTVTTPGVEQTIFSTVIAAGTTKNLTSLYISCRLPTVFNLEAGGVTIASGRTGASTPNAKVTWAPARPIASGTTLELKLLARAGLPSTDVEAYLVSGDVT
jgi:hypothetical protein